MKKLLVLALVLSMATMASAALQISINGDQSAAPITLKPSETASLDVWTDAAIAVNDAMNMLLVCTPGGSIDYMSGIVVAADEGTFIERAGNAHVYLADSAYLLPITEEGLGAYIVRYVNPVSAGGTIFDQIAFHCDAPNVDVTLKIYMVDDAYSMLTLVDTAIIHQIPEPMTLGLLGLGGLFLRRRK